MKAIDLSIPKGAIFSDDEKFRYALWRAWKSSPIIRLQISLNPSKAGALIDDPTITRGIVRANQDGFGAFMQGNMYAYISTDPKELLKGGYYVGDDNDKYLKTMIEMALKSGGQVVCAWGSFSPVFKRAPEVLKMVPEPYCLGINADGQPKHPLYVSYKTQVTPLIVKQMAGKMWLLERVEVSR